eukprot:TRINITY_DN2697_c0_g1_i4.p1 TRINITY_DN2697_c0_g1~~TRINITY_DN2697_c0_g1_i4.p1  ORF type:complete len:1184 (-),score=183.54 TRINITY_DN2697_c0_g1_i4:533-4084(-)
MSRFERFDRTERYEDEEKGIRTTRYSRASWISRLFFQFDWPLLSAGMKRPLQETDVDPIPDFYDASALLETLSKTWEENVRIGNPSLIKTLSKVFLADYVKASCIFGFQIFFRSWQPIFLGRLVSYARDPDSEDPSDMYWTAAGLSLTAFCLALTHHHFFFHTMKVGGQARIAIFSMIQRKAYRISNSSMTSFTTGKIINLLATDAQKLDDGSPFLPYIVLGPLETIVMIGLLWGEIGPSCLAGLMILFSLIPVQMWFSKRFAFHRTHTAGFTDTRVKLLSEVFSGIRSIKMYAWETPYESVIKEVRGKEMASIQSTSHYRALNSGLYYIIPIAMSFFTFLVYTMSGNTLTSAKIFTTISLFHYVRMSMGNFFSKGMECMSEIRVSLKRIEDFLCTEEVAPLAISSDDCGSDKPQIQLSRASFAWSVASRPVLKQIDLSADQPRLIAVVGAVGSGKSSLLSAILGELVVESGDRKVVGRMAYSTQMPWILTGNVRDNILFGKSYNETRYHKVVNCCQMMTDLMSFSDGDLTEIGEKGLTMSGGQKARLSLARALYEEADIYLLDDPLSAVDTKVAEQLYNLAIQEFLRDKIRILVTHQTQYLKDADEIIVLNSTGEIFKRGTFDQVSSEILSGNHKVVGQSVDESLAPETSTSKSPVVQTEGTLASPRSGSEVKTRPLISDEDRSTGIVTLSVYMDYFRAGGSKYRVYTVTLSMLLGQFLIISYDYWLSHWGAQSKEEQEQNNDYYIIVLFILALVCGVVVTIRCFVFFYATINSSKSMHHQMLHAVLRSPVSFFDSNPIGRILNRFSKDMNQADEALPLNFLEFCLVVYMVFGSIIVISFALPYLMIPLFLLFFVFKKARAYYVTSAREIKRMDAVSRSPIFASMSEFLAGGPIIRAFNMQGWAEQNLLAKINNNTRFYFTFCTINRWLAIRLDCCAALIVSCAAFASVVLSRELDSEIAGLMLVYAVQLSGLMQWSARVSAEVENMMTGVERILQYGRLKPEEENKNDYQKPPQNWPSKGSLALCNVQMRYRENLDPVLKGVTFSVQSGEKIGIVGRTGAGKSSLIAALFRLTEACNDDASIIVDGVDIRKIRLHDLRSNISIIPQDPVIFSGTLRRNLDPFANYNEIDVWQALEDVQLKTTVSEKYDWQMDVTYYAGGTANGIFLTSFLLIFFVFAIASM